MVVLTRLLAQCLRHCIFGLRGAYVDSPYAIGLRQLTRLRVLLTQASYDTTPSTHIKGGFGTCSVVAPRCSKVHIIRLKAYIKPNPETWQPRHWVHPSLESILKVPLFMTSDGCGILLTNVGTSLTAWPSRWTPHKMLRMEYCNIVALDCRLTEVMQLTHLAETLQSLRSCCETIQ